MPRRSWSGTPEVSRIPRHAATGGDEPVEGGNVLNPVTPDDNEQVDVREVTAGDETENGENPVRLPPSKLARRRNRGPLRSLIEWVVVIGGAFGLALLIQAFLFQPFRIPSGSMIPTLKVHDRIVVNKVSYHLHDVHRGDVVVFTRPDCTVAGSPKWANCALVGKYDDLVKRVIALPGDHLSIANNHVYVNHDVLDEPYIAKGSVTLAEPPFGCGFPGTVAHPYVVPPHMVFVMGDNRGDSYDSRCFGPISESQVVGRAFVRIWPLNRIGWL